MEREFTVGQGIKVATIAILSIIGIWVVAHTIGIVKIEGNEAVVRQDLFQGVVSDVWLSGTKAYNGWTTDIYKYNIGTQKCTFDDEKSNEGAEYPRIVVDCGENGGQKAYIAMSINYRVGWDDDSGTPVFSPVKLVKLHKDGIGKTYEDVIIKRTVVDVVNKIARPNQALDIYSGQGFVDFKEKIDKELKNHPVFNDRGIYVENTIIYKVYLDSQYEKEIADKVLAHQQKLKLEQQKLAKEEEAKMIFAQSQAQVEQIRQEAEAAKIKQIKEAEAAKETAVLAAQAEKSKRVLEAEGNRDANLAMASGILAVGKAEAEVATLKTNALYAGEGGARRASIELATAQATKVSGLFKGVAIVPEKTILNAGKQIGLTVQDDNK